MTERRRWRPPPMKQAEEDGGKPKVTVDEKVVRKMLQVNPNLRDGRTTFQVKRDMESGHAISTDGRRGTGPVAASQEGSPWGGGGAASGSSGGSVRSELDETISFFVRGKADKLRERLASIAERRKALAQEEEQAKMELRGQLASFVAMLDEKAVAMHGVSCLSKHKDLLATLDLTPAQLLDSARKARK